MHTTLLRGITVCGLVLIGAAGCASNNDGPKVASVKEKKPSPTRTENRTSKDPRDASLAFARCMRREGIDMPDPKASGNGGPTSINVGGPTDLPKLEAAQKKCGPLLGTQNGAPKLDPAQVAKNRKQQLAFAACMRDHGVDMPDPKFDESGNQTAASGSGGASAIGGAGVDQSQLGKAMSACGSKANGGRPVRGTTSVGGGT